MNLLNNHNFNTILIGVAFSPNLKNNIFETIRMINYFNSKMVIVHVGKKTNDKETKIIELISEITDEKKVKIVWEQGDPVKVILETAKKTKANLIILGANPREDLLKFYIGSIARKITRKAHCSVLLLINPSEESRPCNHIVVNGLKEEYPKPTILASLKIAKNLNVKQLTIVEEISQQEVHVIVEDDKSLLKDTIIKERLAKKKELKVKDILKEMPEILKNGLLIKIQPIFGKRGYSIGHYAKIVGADMLIMNAPRKTTLWDRIFPHDLEYILSELPTDVLIMR